MHTFSFFFSLKFVLACFLFLVLRADTSLFLFHLIVENFISNIFSHNYNNYSMFRDVPECAYCVIRANCDLFRNEKSRRRLKDKANQRHRRHYDKRTKQRLLVAIAQVALCVFGEWKQLIFLAWDHMMTFLRILAFHLLERKYSWILQANSLPRARSFFERQIMIKGKDPSSILRQTEAIVFVIFQIFFVTLAILKIRQYH